MQQIDEMPPLVNLHEADDIAAKWISKRMLPLLVQWANNGPYQPGNSCCALCGAVGVIESPRGHYPNCLWKQTVEFVEAMADRDWEAEVSDWESFRDWNDTLEAARPKVL